MDPEEALTALVAKWLIKTLSVGAFPLQILLKY
jgi:hypothetical protein